MDKNKKNKFWLVVYAVVTGGLFMAALERFAEHSYGWFLLDVVLLLNGIFGIRRYLRLI